jgi:PGF-CTERM protein
MRDTTRTLVATILIVALTVSASGVVGAQPAAAETDAAGTNAIAAHQASGYAGTNVTFETRSNALVDYAIDGETVLESVSVDSRSSAESRLGGQVGADLGAVTNVGGSGLSIASRTELSASVDFDSGAEMTAHEGSRGIFVLRSGGESQLATVNLSDSATAESEGQRRVVVTKDDGTDGTFIVVGDGEVTVNDAGNVTANLGQDSSLVFRPYQDGRSDDDAETERLIAEGTAAAEVTVSQAEDGGEYAADVVQYGQDTTVETSQQTADRVNMTVERSQAEGKVVVTRLAESVESAEDVQVYVDGEAAARAESASELESATQNGDGSRFLVANQANAEASGEVLVAIDHFSERSVSVQEDDSTESTDGDTDGGDDSTAGDGAGFTAVLALVALLATALVARYRH